ncbi:YeeE/YedE family protein [Geobacter pelophilus]|uniref:YeeE/YedE family protein n=2 Tax=Geoanaerobacter pelophilus TaxID=60036 RepID=A0AAW4L5U1_9BACT|nr:YeeE/YedE family protein [Geoanaerobacter pelophilus]
MSDHIIPIILLIGLLLGAGSGFIMHRADFCVSGMFRDIFLLKSFFKLRMLMLLVVTSMLLFEAARQAGLLPLYPFPLIGSPSLANLIGGLLFGIGMVLAGGCVVGTLYKMGAGSVPSMVAFFGLIAGSAMYAELHPWWGSIVRRTGFFTGEITVPQLFGIDPFFPVLMVSIISIWYFYRVYRSNGWVRATYADGAMQQWQAALMLAVIGTISYVTVGVPLGITTAYAKIAGYCESLLFPEHFQSLSYFKLLPVNYFHALSGIQFVGGPGPKLDAIVLLQFPVVAGIVIGSASSALLLKEFKIFVDLPLRQYISAFIGGIIMGLASRMAPACNVWHLFGGLPIMAMQSILFVAGIIPGAWLGTLFLTRLVLR